MHQFSFERLNVWQRGRELCKLIYQISKSFPADEKFGATQQIRRAALSITCNLAEGSSRHKAAEKARFSEIAFGSLMEVLNLLIMGVDLEFIEEKNPCRNKTAYRRNFQQTQKCRITEPPNNQIPISPNPQKV